MGVPFSDTEMDMIIKGFLETLTKYQANAVEKDPIKAKSKPRFVIGMKQVTNGAKSGRARLILLASDSEQSEAIDSKLKTLITEASTRMDAHDEPIPILYCMNRRKLGKAIGTTIRVAAVAVYNPDGLFPVFRQIVEYIRRESSDGTPK